MRLKAKYPNENWWGFRVDAPNMPPPLPRSQHIVAPTPDKQFSVTPAAKLSIRRVAEAPPPKAELADFGIASDGQEPGDIGVLLPKNLHTDLMRDRQLSDRIEQGGFLIGDVFTHGEYPGKYLLALELAVTAEHTGASFLHLTFTGDSFVEVKRSLRQEHKGKRLLGWYHTHLFPASDTFGLSSIDVNLHLSTFSQPWQVAGLVNLDLNNGDRTLRFYQRQGNEMTLCSHYIYDERN